MKSVFCLAAGLVLIIIQTAIFPLFPLFSGFFDIMLPLVLYLSLNRPSDGSFVIIFLLGVIQDNVSAAPYGLYLITYAWIFFCVRWMTSILHSGNKILRVILVAVAVLFQNGIVVGIFFITGNLDRLPENTPVIIVQQLVWALFAGIAILIAIKRSIETLEKYWDKFRENENGSSG